MAQIVCTPDVDEMAFAWITWSNLDEDDYKAMVASRQKRNSN